MVQLYYMRLDMYLTEHGLATSRNRAQELVSRGFVFVNNTQKNKASYHVSERDYVEIRGNLNFVSRAGEKLSFALEHFAVDPYGKHVLDIGSSTGGFTDAIIQKGANSVTAVDVGTNQFNRDLAQHKRIELHEKTDIRTFDNHKTYDLIVIDVSFISQKEIIPHLERFSKKGAEVLSLIKPQFEVGKSGLGKNGIVDDLEKVKGVLGEIVELYQKHGFLCEYPIEPCPVQGREGNQEYFIYCKK